MVVFVLETHRLSMKRNFPDPEELKKQLADAKAKRAAGRAGGANGAAPVANKGPSPEELQQTYLKKREERGWADATGLAKEWWESFEKQNSERVSSMITLLTELEKRDATVTEFFGAYIYSNDGTIEGNLAYLDKMKSAEANGSVKEVSGEEAVREAA